MLLTVESVTGSTITVNVVPTDTVQRLKLLISNQEGIPPEQLSLIYHETELSDLQNTLQNYNIFDGCCIRLVPHARAGPLGLGDANRVAESASEWEALIDLLDQAGREFQIQEPGTSKPDIVKRSRWSDFVQSNSTDLEHDDNTELDLTFTKARQLSAQQRADDNLRTMHRMRELRENIEKMNFERSKIKRKNIIEPSECENGLAISTSGVLPVTDGRQRKSSGSAKSKLSARAFPCPGLLSAPEDTSAKESSAGETEYEERYDFYPLVVATQNNSSQNCPACRAAAGTAVALCSSTNEAPKSSWRAYQQTYRRAGEGFRSRPPRVVSSSSEMEFASDWETGITSDQADNADMYVEALEHVAPGLGDANGQEQDGDEEDIYLNAQQDYWSDSEDESGHEEGGQLDANPEYSDKDAHIAECKAQFEAENNLSDPSEWSSGMIMFDMPDSRRTKVRRKVKAVRKPVEDTEDWSDQEDGKEQKAASVSPTAPRSDERPMAARVRREWMLARQNSDSALGADHNRAGQYCAVHANATKTRRPTRGAIGNRARSKPRFVPAATVNLVSTTGESSSDEKGKVAAEEPSFGLPGSYPAKWKANGFSRRVSGVDTARRVTAAASRLSRKFSNDGHIRGRAQPLLFGCIGSTLASSSVVPLRHKAPQSSQSQQRCSTCGFRLHIASTFQCRCGKTVCSKHRNAEAHACSYDYRSDAKKVVGPKVVAEKLPKI